MTYAWYQYVVVGKQQSPLISWTKVLAHGSKFINSVTGPIVGTVLLLDIENDLSLEFEFGEKGHEDLEPSETIYFDTANKSNLSFSTDKEYWEFSVGHPFSDSFNSNVGEKLLVELWTCLSPLDPQFALAGEELTVSDLERVQIIHGRIQPTDLSLCDMAIISNLLDQNENGYETILIPRGKLIRKRAYP
ncbi:MAG: hypothetical protein K2X81_25630 [Candidatus Obscuribacterales bacterium]|nr:hypothetical protein [Candidatus Obscuribacterales bacterium]